MLGWIFIAIFSVVNIKDVKATFSKPKNGAAIKSWGDALYDEASKAWTEKLQSQVVLNFSFSFVQGE